MKLLFVLLFLSIAANGQRFPRPIRLANHAKTLECPPATSNRSTDLVLDVETNGLYGCDKGERIFLVAATPSTGVWTGNTTTSGTLGTGLATGISASIASGDTAPPAKEPVKDAPKQDEPKTDWRYMKTLIALTAISCLCAGYWIGLALARWRSEQCVGRIKKYAAMGLSVKQVLEIEDLGS